MQASNRLILHPFLLAAFPVLALLAYNIQEIKLITGLRPLIVSILVAGGLLLVLKALFIDWQRAALICSMMLVLFFSYGHTYNALEQVRLSGMILGRHRYFLPVWTAALGLGLWWAMRPQRDLPIITQTLNLVGGILVIFPAVQMVFFGVRVLPSLAQEPTPAAESSNLHLPEGRTPPDIYYIILDAYTRDDVFRNIFDFDNTPFLSSLEEMGFWVARCSQSNYSQTRLSLAASLNLDYLDENIQEVTSNSEEVARIHPSIRHSAVRRGMEQLGYAIVSFETGHLATQWEDADYYFSPNTSPLGEAQNLGRVSEFEAMLLRTTAGLAVLDVTFGLPQRFLQEIDRSYWDTYRERILYTLDRLERVPQIKGPKFVFAHILAPHPPFAFGSNGEVINEERGKIVGYRDQAIYINKRIISVLESIIRQSDQSPIIILQGDHGPGSFSPEERMAILNAYYLPGGEERNLYDSISPVNSFRVVFNLYFSGSFPLLEDTSYFTVSRKPYEFKIIPNPRPGCDTK